MYIYMYTHSYVYIHICIYVHVTFFAFLFFDSVVGLCQYQVFALSL